MNEHVGIHPEVRKVSVQAYRECVICVAFDQATSEAVSMDIPSVAGHVRFSAAGPANLLVRASAAACHPVRFEHSPVHCRG